MFRHLLPARFIVIILLSKISLLLFFTFCPKNSELVWFRFLLSSPLPSINLKQFKSNFFVYTSFLKKRGKSTTIKYSYLSRNELHHHYHHRHVKSFSKILIICYCFEYDSNVGEEVLPHIFRRWTDDDDDDAFRPKK